MAFDLSKSGFGVESNLDKIQKIRISDVRSNDKNFYDVSDTEQLEGSIEMVGLLNPVLVIRDGKCGESGRQLYRLISGHRRLKAYHNINDRRMRDSNGSDTSYCKIPAIIIGNMDEITEEIALITANSTARELTYADKLRQSERLRALLMARKAAGQDVPKNLGQYMADQLGTSRNEVSRMKSVSDHLIPEARELVDKGEINAATAYDLSRKPEVEQRRAISDGPKKIDGKKALDDIRSELAEDRAIIRDFVSKHLFGLLSYGVAYADRRIDAINELKLDNRNRGFCNMQGMFTGKGAAGAEISLPNTRTVKVTWTDLYDEIVHQALIACMDLHNNGASNRPLWRTDRPRDDGNAIVPAAVIATFPSGDNLAIAYRRGSKWYCDSGCEIEMSCTCKVLKWTALPDTQEDYD